MTSATASGSGGGSGRSSPAILRVIPQSLQNPVRGTDNMGNNGTPDRPKSPFDIPTPKSAIIQVPPGWGDSPYASTSGSRNSFDADQLQMSSLAQPLSAVSPSSPSQPFFNWQAPFVGSSKPHMSSSRPVERSDPFDTTSTFSDDPFGRRSSSSSSNEEDRRSSRQSSFTDQFDLSNAANIEAALPLELGDTRRTSLTLIPHQFRAATADPVLGGGNIGVPEIPIDPEFHAAGGGSGMEFQFDADLTPGAGTPAPPTFVRTFSAPLPNRVGYLRHPLSPARDPTGSYSAHLTTSSTPLVSSPLTARPTPRPYDTSSSETAVASESPKSEHIQTPLQTLSLELADSVQAAIQTLLHLSPPHLLDNAKEQYSGCTIQMPSTSLSALLTSMKALNYLSANVEALASGKVWEDEKDAGILGKAKYRHSEDFDIGELLQNVADLLSGQAAQAGVDLVLFHGDVGIKHVNVSGDGEGLAYTLSHILRQILLVASKGDTIELGLQIIPQSPSMTPKVSLPLTASDVDIQRQARSGSGARSSSPGRTLPSPPSGNLDGPLLCIFEIVHNSHSGIDSNVATPRAEKNPFTTLSEQKAAAEPKLNTLLCRRLLQSQNASLREDTQPSSPNGSGLPRRAYELSVLVPRGKPMVEPVSLTVEEEAIRQPFSAVRLAREPTLEELSTFAESLRGKKVFLHANLTSVFARHLTSYLAAWGMDISHIPIEEILSPVQTDRLSVSTNPSPRTIQSPAVAEIADEIASLTISPSDKPKDTEQFIIIDDDVAVLRRELIRLRTEANPMSLKPRLNRRPTFANRAKSTPHIRQTSIVPRLGVVLIHFTGLANYNHVRDTVTSLLGTPSLTGSGAFIHPEVMVIPKPVGPRRFLTALHTAVNQPVVDPFFAPIATSPRSPGGGYFSVTGPRTPAGDGVSGGFFDSVAEESPDEQVFSLGANGTIRTVSESSGSQKARSPLGEFPPQGPVVRTVQGLHLALPTPGEVVATPASEYFSSTRSNSSAASALVMQSPDGRPFGMFFEPPVKNERRVSLPRTNSMRKDSHRKSSPSVTIGEDGVPGSTATSPQSSKRAGMTAEDRTSSRRSSGRGGGGGAAELNPDDSPDLPAAQSQRKTLRRTTLPANDQPPIMAKGRERSSTVTQGSLRRKNTTGSPKIPEEATVPTPGAVPRSKKTTKLVMDADALESPGPVVKKVKEEVVVPPINVLIVEDNPINQNILSMFLRKKKIKHQSAKDGLEAVEKWRTGGFHLILMDIQLPVMDGIEATKEIRKLEKNNNIGVFPSTPMSEHSRPLSALSDAPATAAPPSSPFRSSVIIVALTASSLQSDRVNALAAGCNDFLTKPVSLKWLERKIVEWGCMQALIDFDGWRRWKSSDPKDHAGGEMKKGFQTGPQAAAKNLASRLRIERKPTRTATGSSSSIRSESLNSISGVADAPGPEINVRTATPDAVEGNSRDKSLASTAAHDLQAAREDLQENMAMSAQALESPPDEVQKVPKALEDIDKAKDSPLRNESTSAPSVEIDVP